LNGELERDAAAHRIAEHVNLVVADLLQHAGHVVAHVNQADLAITQRGAAVTLQVNADHLPVHCQLGQGESEHLGVEQAAMKEQQRLATAVDRVVVVHTVDCGMAAFGGFGYCIFHSWFLLRCLNDARGQTARGNSRKHCD
jgi:hypothetical protein